MSPTVGRRIRTIRTQRKPVPSQAAVARAAKISRVTLNRIEHGTQVPTLATLRRLAKALGVPVMELLH